MLTADGHKIVGLMLLGSGFITFLIDLSLYDPKDFLGVEYTCNNENNG